MFGNNLFNTNGAFPVFFNADNELTDTKLSHDSYDVYVNEEYIGKKTLLTQTEKPSDIDTYLKDRGFHNFNSNIAGDHITINSAYEDSDNIKRNLQMYLNLR